ncbi:MAG: glycosyltransferase [Symploca sp. SIO3E6]|nr:glycosyltransferase [Caldora sp. SIO3E6]
MSRIPILVIGAAVEPTGYARVVRSILERLQARYEFHHFGFNYQGAPLNNGWKIYPNVRMGDIFGAEQLPDLLVKIRPQLVWIVHDYYMNSVHRKSWDKFKHQFKIVHYCPIDGTDASPRKFEDVEKLDRLVLFTQFGWNVVESALAKLAQEQPKLRLPSLDIIPHGIDSHLFRPCASNNNFYQSRQQARRQLFPQQPELQDAFIVLNANRNDSRKRVDITLEAFALFARNKPNNVKLYLHMEAQHRGYNVQKLAKQYGITDRLLLTTTETEQCSHYVSDEQLNLIYNACDVGLNTSTGEGWGLIPFEHGATGAAQIMPRHSACAELWEDVAILIDPVSSFYHPLEDVQHQIVSAQDVATALEDLYSQPELLRKKSEQAYALATSSKFQWDNIAQQWDQLFTELCLEGRQQACKI